MSKVNVNTIEPSTGTDITLGASGDTITVPSGATIANSGTATGFGVSLANGADNRVVTSSSTTALNGEANLTFDGSTFTATGTSSLDGAVVINETGADLDFRVEGDTDANMIYGDASSNNVGIGYATPQGKLHIYRGASGQGSVDANSDELVLENSGHTGMTILSGTSSSGYIVWGDSGNNAIGRIFYNHASNYMRFDTNASEAMRIDTDGRLFVNSTTVQQAALVNVAHGGNSVAGISFNDTDSASNATYASFIKGGTLIGNIRRNGSADAVNYNTSSDYRLKDGIVDKTDGIEKIKLLKPRKFYWKSDSDKTLVDGFLAHEVSDVVPEAISGVKDAMTPEVLYDEEILYTTDDELPEDKNIGDVKHSIGDIKEATKINPQGIDQSKIVPLLVASVQELIAENETLKTRITALENA